MTKKALILSFVVLFVLFSAVQVEALRRDEIYGTKALGMGGAFTAVADDVTTTYWNPAGLTQSGSFGLKTSAGLDEDILDVVGEEIVYSHVEDGEQQLDYLKLDDEKLGEHKGNLNFFSGLQLSRFALSFLGTGAIESNSDLYQENLSTEAILSTASDLDSDSFSLGLNLKGLLEQRNQIRVGREESVEAVGYSLDLGALYHPFNWLSLGINARDIHSELNWDDENYDLVPEADRNDSKDMTVTAGAAFDLPFSTMIAADISYDDGAKEDEFSSRVGVENSLFPIFSFRAGAYEDSLEDDWVTTYGLGINLAIFELNYATVDTEDNYHELSAQISF